MYRPFGLTDQIQIDKQFLCLKLGINFYYVKKNMNTTLITGTNRGIGLEDLLLMSAKKSHGNLFFYISSDASV